MIDRQEAQRRAEAHAAELEPERDDLRVAEENTIEEDRFCVFIVNCQAFIEDGDVMAQLLSIPPLLVNKHDGSVHELPTQYPPEHYLDRYR